MGLSGGVVYASLSDLQALGLPAQAFIASMTAAAGEALQAASDEVSAAYNSRFTLPLVSWDYKTAQVTAAIAAEWLLLNNRGASPSDDTAKFIQDGAKAARDYLERVQANLVTPLVTDSSSTGATPAVQVSSLPSRGWFPTNSGFW